MTHACRPLTAWRRPALPVREAALIVCAGALLLPPKAAAQTCGDPSFGTSPGASLPQAPRGLVVGDFDRGPGRGGVLDGVVVDAAGRIALLRGDGSGTLVPQTPLGTLSDPRDLVTGDFNRDGKLDLAVAAAGSSSVAFFSGDGLGGFTAQTPFALGVAPTRLAAADLDRNGRTDLVIVSETGNLVIVLLASGDFAFTRYSPDLAVVGPTAVAIGDFDRRTSPVFSSGWLDLAVARRAANRVQIYAGRASGPSVAFDTGASVVTSGPVDIAAGDVDRDGKLDLATVDTATGLASVLKGDGLGGFTVPETPTVGTAPVRVALSDFDRDGDLDLVVLDGGAGVPVVTVVPRVQVPSPQFDLARSASLPLPGTSIPVALALGDIRKDGRPDVLVAVDLAGSHAAVTGVNASGPDCALSAFADAPRAFAAGDLPVAVAAANMDADGIPDLVVAASGTPSTIEVLKGSGGLYASILSVPVTAAPPRGVAVADFDTDGDQDVVAALGSATVGQIRLYRGDGLGGLSPDAPLSTSLNASAVVAGDFDGNGAPDVAVTSQGGGLVQVFRGTGTGAFLAPTTIGTAAAPRALAAGDLDGNGTLDLVVAESGGSTVRVFLGAGDGVNFAAGPGSPLAVGLGPWGVALGDFDGNGALDLVTADHDAVPPTLTVRLGLGTGGFGAGTTFPVDGPPFAVAALDVTGDGLVDIAAVTGTHTLNVLAGDGGGGFATPAAIYPARTRPSAITPVDADADGRLDLAVPCRDADSVVVFLAQPSGLREAARVAVGAKPSAAATADLDADGDLDLAVVNTSGNSVTILTNDGLGTLSTHVTLSVGLAPQAVVAADFDRDGTLDLAVSNAQANNVSLLRGLGGADFAAAVPIPAGSTPNDLAVGDFDRDGDLDLAVCNKLTPTGTVTILVNNGAGGFSTGSISAVGDTPTSVAVADLDGNGTLDLAVANNLSRNLMVRFGNGSGGFGPALTLTLHALDSGPVSVAAADLDEDGDLDLATAAFSSNALNVFENVSASFGAAIRRPTSYLPDFVTSADVNRDGQIDLVMAADGAKVLRGRSSLSLEPAEDMVAGLGPSALVVGDLDRDGRPDLVVTNSNSDDVSILLSTACSARRLAVSSSPSACVLGAPFQVAALVEARDDGGNKAACATGSVVPSIVPGTGTPSAVLTPSTGVDLANGEALFDPLTVSLAGPRYRLRFDLAGVAPAVSRSFTLGPALAIVGPPTVCNASPVSHSVDPVYDSYLWTTDSVPYGFTPSITLSSPPLGSLDVTYVLGAEARIDGCVLNDSLNVVLASPLSGVSANVVGPTTVCVDCLGGTITATEMGGGPAQGRQWGYRTVPLTGGITPLAGQTSSTYVINGLDFPGPGTYYLVETTQPTCGSASTSNDITVMVETAVPSGEVRSLGATSRDFAGRGRNVLQWVNTSGSLEEIRVRWNVAPIGTSLCNPPPSPTAGSFDGELVISSPGPSTKGTFTHDDLEFDTAYCYSVFSKASGAYAPGRVVKGRPFDTTGGPEKWAYYTGATAVVPPVVTFSGLLAMSNDQTVHSVERGLNGGTWPLAWTPRPLTGVAHSRSPVVPFTIPVAGATTVLFVGDDAGDVVALDAVSGAPVWGPVTPFTPTLGAMITGAPGGTFVQYGGPADLVLVGTRNNDSGEASQFVALRLADGFVGPNYFDGVGTPGGGLGPVSGTPAVDNANGLVYFTSRRFGGTGHSVWCLQTSASSPPAYVWSRDFGDIDASPVSRGGRLYVANTTGDIYSIDTADPDSFRTYLNPDGPVKGFLFPNRGSDELIYASNSSVRSLSDTVAGLVSNWTWNPAGLEPSIVLFWPETTFVYVGAQDGTLYQLDFGAGAPSTTCDPYPGLGGSTCISLVLGNGIGHIGAPSLDIGLVPPEISPGKAMLYVGSESGGLHAVEVPFP